MDPINGEKIRKAVLHGIVTGFVILFHLNASVVSGALPTVYDRC